MLTRILSLLFKSDDYSIGYKAHPIHVVLSILIMAAGTVTFLNDGWFWFGLITFVLGAALGITIILAINWDKSTEYWETINEHVRIMMKANNPDLWQALGYTHPPAMVEIKEIKQEDKESGFQMKFKRLPVSPATMNMIANKVLLSKDTKITQEILSNYGISNARKVHKQLRSDGLIKANVTKNGREIPTQGYSWNAKGMELIYQYADETIKAQLKEEK